MTAGRPAVWTGEQEAAVRALRADGLSFGNISQRLEADFGAVFGPHAVKNKASRLELPRVERMNKGDAGAVALRAKRARASSNEPAPWVEPPVPAHLIPVPLAHLTENGCRYPLGDPRSERFGYCGAERHGPLSYCKWHAQLCYQAADKPGRAE